MSHHEVRGWEAVAVYCPCGYQLPHPPLAETGREGWSRVVCMGCQQEVVGQFWREQTGMRFQREVSRAEVFSPQT